MAHPFVIDEAYLTQVLVEMVQINSSNPSLTPGAPGEAALGEHIAEQMSALGLEVTTHELGPTVSTWWASSPAKVRGAH